MPHCPQCGAAHAEGARYCAACGSALGPPALPLQAAPPAPTAPKDTSSAQLVILIGAVLAGFLPLLIGLFLFAFGAAFATALPFFGAIPGGLLAFFGVLLVLGGLVFGAAGLWARNMVRDGEAEKGGMVAGAVGLVACLTGNVFGGLALLLGGVMAYTAK